MHWNYFLVCVLLVFICTKYRNKKFCLDIFLILRSMMKMYESANALGFALVSQIPFLHPLHESFKEICCFAHLSTCILMYSGLLCC